MGIQLSSDRQQSAWTNDGDQDVEATRMPILSSTGLLRPSSNWVDRFTFLLIVFVGALLVIVIGVTSSTNKMVHDLGDKISTTSSSALGLPGYESLTWTDVVAQGVQGQVVNVYIDSSSARMWRWFKYTAKPMVLAKYGITLNVDTTLATAKIVELIETEVAAGKTTSGGSVDIFWANGINYNRAKTGNAMAGYTTGWGSTSSGLGNVLYGPWANKVPSAAAYNWATATIAYDMGTANDGYEMPMWAANFNLIYRTDIITSPPKTFKELVMLANTLPANGGIQGKFTYWNPSNYITQAFIRHFLYEGCVTTLSSSVTTAAAYNSATTCSNNYAQYLGSYKQSLYSANVKNAFQQLRFLESGFGGASMPSNTKINLEGAAYCTSQSDCMGKFDTGAVYMVMEFSAPYAGSNCASVGTGTTSWSGDTVQNLAGTGTVDLCANTKAYIPETTGAIANNNFVMIPKNAANKMGAVAVGNWLGSLDAQYSRRYGSNVDSTCTTSDATCNVVNRWIGNFDTTKPEYTGADGGPSWATAYDYLGAYHNYAQTPDIEYLRPPYSLPELDPSYGLQMAADWVTCMELTASGAAYSTAAPCA